jgi:serine/threonine protein kinase
MTKINHANIAACYGIGKYDDDDEQNPGSLFIVQELIKGGNLLHKVYKQMLNRQKAIYTSQEALKWMINVAEGMQYLHSVVETKPMIIHRDLKLENIMLATSHRTAFPLVAKLVDFGLHKVIDDRIKKVVKRVVSEAFIGGSRMGLRGRPAAVEEAEEDDELEMALAEQRAKARARGGEGKEEADVVSPIRSPPDSRSRLGRVMSRAVMEPHAEIPEEEEMDEDTIITEKVDAPPSEPQGVGFSPQAVKESPVDPTVKLRAPPKKQSSMQKLMAKMKDIRLKIVDNVTGRTTATQPSTSSSLTASSTSAGATPISAEDALLKDKMARNEALLNRIIAQQSTQAQNSPMTETAADDSMILDGGAAAEAQRAKKPPPRRAVTWVNEIRYNLTEAVGSWAYMAPEVVLGHPYNEKVDVFSFGVILFEVLLRKLMLVDEIKNDPRKDAQAYAERVANGFRPAVPRHWPSDLVSLITSCWAQDPHVRPNFVAIVDILKELEEKGEVGKLDVAQMTTTSVYI